MTILNISLSGFEMNIILWLVLIVATVVLGAFIFAAGLVVVDWFNGGYSK